ncbi:hypothetical protein OK348_15305 [Flavobacterium sp. MXW15]|uniref:Transmembrane protein n=1 Tax=Xanthomonas chitinilytica TaxID=2989819 RepID=A0ABT3JZ53_9XANT|nr:hypothetical protein [Xanthomonas sp. H13-6]MCW4456156.1 hypothetical protein [Flavobacterium sp. MXW15]MCW4473753.1 hypothetical protein [Xanthomonas sp. H13-6]
MKGIPATFAVLLSIVALARSRPQVNVRLDAPPPSPPVDPERGIFYGATLSAWYASAMEHDKSLLTLSTAGIGLLVGFMSSRAAGGMLPFWLLVGGMIAFLLTILLVLRIYHVNKSYLERIIRSEDSPDEDDGGMDDARLKRLDLAANVLFLIGASLSAVLGGVIAYSTHRPPQAPLLPSEPVSAAEKPSAGDPVPVPAPQRPDEDGSANHGHRMPAPPESRPQGDPPPMENARSDN